MVVRFAAVCLIIAAGLAGSAALYAAEGPAENAPAEKATEEAAPSSFVSLKFEGACDEQNNRLWLSNAHTFKTIVTRVRWRAAGGKDLNEEFYPAPNTVREIGCAAEAEILSAEFAAF